MALLSSTSRATLADERSSACLSRIPSAIQGSIFIEFKDKESADNLLNTEPKPTFEGMTEPIMVMRK